VAVKASSGQVRIIGGRWRGRKLRFPPVPGLRPSPDRIRETLFNWLAPELPGSSCLDLFAGSGALGIEALSRGASDVTLVERDARAVSALRQHAQALGAAGLQICQADVITFLQRPAKAVDIVFLDPPFRSQWYEKICQTLTLENWLKPSASVYVEMPRGLQFTHPPGWSLHRRQNAGEVQGDLYRFSST